MSPHVHNAQINVVTRQNKFHLHAPSHSVGGSVPVVFSYVSEFFTEKQTGPIVVITAACWQPGIAFTGKNY